jgi:MOSC domain-containing protein YiiM
VSGTIRHLTIAELEAGLEHIRRSPQQRGTLDMIVRRPRSEEREVLDVARLDVRDGLLGDRWAQGARRGGEQLTLMNSRVVALLAQTRERWPLAGDQLYVDLDLSGLNVPPGTRLAIGAAVVEVSVEPHTGCSKFRARYGHDALRFVSSATGTELQLRGVNASVVTSGDVRVGDEVYKL